MCKATYKLSRKARQGERQYSDSHFAWRWASHWQLASANVRPAHVVDVAVATGRQCDGSTVATAIVFR